MKAPTILCLAALLMLAACDRHDADGEAAPAPEAAASDNSAFLEGGIRSAPAASEAEAPSAPAAHADRGPPPVVAPIVRDGVRYAQGEDGRDPGLTQASGVLVVSDDFSGKRLWTLAVYPESADATKAPGARWVYFKTMAFDADGQLRIVNEDDKAFLVDVRRHTSTPVAPK
ncbi:MAG TPA: hypothetical protein VIP05_17565 [Burkholderiaceae bacterium]